MLNACEHFPALSLSLFSIARLEGLFIGYCGGNFQHWRQPWHYGRALWLQTHL